MGRWWTAGLLLAGGALLAGCDDASFSYETEAFAAVKPAEISHHETAVWRVSLPPPRFLATLPAGDVVVVGGLQGVVLDTNGVARSTFSWHGVGVATAVASGPYGNVFVGTANRVVACGVAAASEPLVWESLGENARITGLAVDAGQVWACDAGQRTVWRFDREGRLQGQLPPSGAKNGLHFVVPSPFFAAAAAGDGTFWVVNPGRTELLHVAADGKTLASWAKPGMTTPGFCGCCNPAFIAWLRDGSLVTSEKQIARVKIYGADGTYRSVVASSAMLSAGGEGHPVAVDRFGRILVLDGDRIRVFTR